MYDPNDYFSNDINSEYWDDVYYDETHPDHSGPRYGGGSRSNGHSPLFWAFVIGLLFEFIIPDAGAWAFIITFIIVALSRKFS